MENLTPKQLKLAVTRSIAIRPALSAEIVEFLGYEPRWSTMTVTQLHDLQYAWEVLTTSEREAE